MGATERAVSLGWSRDFLSRPLGPRGGRVPDPSEQLLGPGTEAHKDSAANACALARQPILGRLPAAPFDPASRASRNPVRLSPAARFRTGSRR